MLPGQNTESASRRVVSSVHNHPGDDRSFISSIPLTVIFFWRSVHTSFEVCMFVTYCSLKVNLNFRASKRDLFGMICHFLSIKTQFPDNLPNVDPVSPYSLFTSSRIPKPISCGPGRESPMTQGSAHLFGKSGFWLFPSEDNSRLRRHL